MFGFYIGALNTSTNFSKYHFDVYVKQNIKCSYEQKVATCTIKIK